MTGDGFLQLRVRVEPLDSALPYHDKITVLRGQLTIIRTRAEQGIPVSVESLARAENLARSIESQELTS